MSRKTDRRTRLLTCKNENPFGMKARFVRDFVFRGFKSYANSQLNYCGWLFEDGSYNHKLWKLYHCDIEENERFYGYRMKMYEEKYGRNNFQPTFELRDIFLDYLKRSYDLYKQTLKLHQPMKQSQAEFYLSWFEKNIKKYDVKY